MSDTLFPPAAPDFSDPIGLLKACHTRIQAHCETLQRLLPHLRQQGLDGEARQAIGRVLRYFGSAAQHHHEDEEQEIFPRLVRQSLKLADLIHRLRSDHQAMAERWAQMQPLLQRPENLLADLDAFAAQVEAFSALYEGHIRLEEEELLEIARHILSSADLAKIGQAMAERRGQRWGA